MVSTPQPRRSRSNSTTSALSSAAPSVSSPLGSRVGGPSYAPSTSAQPDRRFTPSSISSRNNAANTSVISLSSPRFLKFEQSTVSGGSVRAPSVAGSIGTTATTQPGGVSRFKRGHQRKKLGPVGVPVVTANPDEFDLMALEEPDQLFRIFPVRDVRGLEKRASDAAAAKVAELRTMVGERYRDLLSAADSIVRMRSAAVKLVERLDAVNQGVEVSAPGLEDSPTKRPAKGRRSSSALQLERTLASPPTLSLTIHLLLSIPSTVHSLLESSSFLAAARLEGVARIVYRELATFGNDEEEDEEDEPQQGLLTAFPIIERQWESVAGLGAVIARRARAELRTSDSNPITTAETLAAIMMLENGSLPSSLSLLLEARSKAVSSILDRPKTRKSTQEIDHVISDLTHLLELVLQTVDAATAIFGPSGVLLQLLRAVESPSTAAKAANSNEVALAPILNSLPNQPLLAKHLPTSILDFTPFLSLDSDRHALPPATAQAQIQSWLERESARVVSGIDGWLTSLHSGARVLAQVRQAVKASLAAGGPSAALLKAQLDKVIENRLAAVYQSHFDKLVDRVEPCLVALLKELPLSAPDLDTAEFLFEAPLAFPPSGQYASPVKAGGKTVDPFHTFLDKVQKRVQGRSPLVDRGLCELEAHARDLRVDLQGWLASEGDDHAEPGSRLRLRELYVHSARESLGRVFEALSAVMQSVASDVVASLFLGNLAFLLSRSQSFTRDLLLGSAPTQHSQERSILDEWNGKLAELQARSLEGWREQSVAGCVQKIEDSLSQVAVSSSDTALAVWEASRAASAKGNSLALPTHPSPAVLSSVRHLASAVRRVGLHRTQANPSIVKVLLSEFESKCRIIAREFVEVLGKVESKEEQKQLAMQTAWDLAFLRRIWGDKKEAEWKEVESDLLQMTESPSLANELAQSTLAYLQRTQNAIASLLVYAVPTALSTSATPLLRLGAGPSSELKSVALMGMANPGPRLGLLPTELRAGRG